MDNNNSEKKTNKTADFRKRNPYTMYRIDSSDRFIEFLAPRRTEGEDFYKVCINIIRYNKETKKQINKVTYYLDVACFKALLNDIKTFRLQNAILKLPDGYTAVKNWELLSGSSENECKKFSICRSLDKNTNTDRLFAVGQTKENGCLIKIENGRGKKNNDGTYVINSKEANPIVIPISFTELMKMALQCSDRLTAFEIECQLSGSYSSVEAPTLVSDVRNSLQAIIQDTIKVTIGSILSNMNLGQIEENNTPATPSEEDTVNENNYPPHIEDSIPQDDYPIEDPQILATIYATTYNGADLGIPDEALYDDFQ